MGCKREVRAFLHPCYSDAEDGASRAGRIADIHAVVLEMTGDVSVLTRQETGPELLERLRGA